MMFINCGRERKDHLCPKILLFTSVLTGGICQLYCPELAELGSSTQLTCINPHKRQVTYRPTNVDTSVAACDPDDGCTVTDGERFSATNINKTHSRLTITSVQESDGGEWICEDAFNSATSRCTIYPFRTPKCHITSGNDTNNLDIHENISLSVNVTDYYCSTPVDFLLRVGYTEEVLLKNHTVEEKSTTSDVFNSSFKVMEKHIGSVQLIFICNNINRTVECGGVQTLQRRPPLCNISANRDAGGLKVGDEITMTVYIEDYSCSRSLEFFLLTGGEKDKLNMTGIYNETITFTVEESHFGPVYLDMNCNDVSQNFTCDGIKQLRKGQNTTTSTFPPDCGERNGPIIVTGIIAGVAFTIAISILIWYLVMLRRKSSGKSSGLKDVPYADVSDNINARPKSVRFDGAYAEVTDTNGTFSIKGYDKDSKPEIQMVPNPGYESVDDVREELSQSRNSKVQNTDNSDVYSKVNKNRVSSASVDGFC